MQIKCSNNISALLDGLLTFSMALSFTFLKAEMQIPRKRGSTLNKGKKDDLGKLVLFL